jgi:hypothetical protein
MCCMICLEWQKGNMTSKEAYRAISEVVQSEEDEDIRNHLFQLSDKIIDKEMPDKEWDEDSIIQYLNDIDEEPFQED